MDSVYSIVFTPDERGLISGSLDNTSKHWDLTALLKRPVRNGPVSLGGPSSTGSLCTQSFTGHKNYVLCVAASYDGAWVVSGSKDRTVQFWDAKTAEAQFILQGHRDSVISADLSPTGHMLVTGSGDCHAKLCERLLSFFSLLFALFGQRPDFDANMVLFCCRELHDDLGTNARRQRSRLIDVKMYACVPPLSVPHFLAFTCSSSICPLLLFSAATSCGLAITVSISICPCLPLWPILSCFSFSLPHLFLVLGLE